MAGHVPLDRLAIFKPAAPRQLRRFAKFLFGLPLSILRVRAYLKRARPDAIRVNGAIDLAPVIGGWMARCR